MPKPFSTALRVRYVECDMQGHVFNAHYLTWFDLAHTELLREAVGPYAALVERTGRDLVVAESGVRHLAAARFDDELRIAVEPDALTTSSMTSRFTVWRGDDRLAEGFLRHVCVDAVSHRKAPWPEELRTALAPYVAG
ncbi:MAG TPA: thioesterase family protein [Baekduia sp.]|nr:thioesterase family protein [Baekduia sp.]